MAAAAGRIENGQIKQGLGRGVRPGGDPRLDHRVKGGGDQLLDQTVRGVVGAGSLAGVPGGVALVGKADKAELPG